MDLIGLLRTMAALATVLGLLAGALWIVRRYNIRLPGAVGTGTTRRLALVERVGVDARRSVALIRRDGKEHLILLAPEGNMMIETGIERSPDEIEAEAARLAEAPATAAKPAEDFAAMVERIGAVRTRTAKAIADAASAAKTIKQRAEVKLNMAPRASAPLPAKRPAASRKPRARKIPADA